jgi:hypothetical protein
LKFLNEKKLFIAAADADVIACLLNMKSKPHIKNK